MRFASVRQIVVLTALWAAALYTVEFVMRPHPYAATAAAASRRPHVTLSVNHLCCSGCLTDLSAAVRGLPWAGSIRMLGGSLPSRAAADAGGERLGGTANRVEIEIVRLNGVDFVALEAAVRRAGFAVAHMEVSGIPHYHLEADLPHLCCRVCSLAAEQESVLARTLRGSGRFRWLDSISVQKPRKRLIAYARYGQTADVSEFEDAVAGLGFAPSAIRLSVAE